MNDSKRVDRLFEIISEMPPDEQMKLLFELENTAIVRKHPRAECLIRADYVARGRSYQGYVQDISAEGAFIESGKFANGDEVKLTISYSDEVEPFELDGEVVRIDPNGVGVRFKHLNQANKEMIKTIISKTCED